MAEIIDQITEVDYGIILEMIIDSTITEEITDGTIIEIILGKTIEKIDIEIQDLEIEAVVEMGIEIITEVFQERILNETGEILVGTKVRRDNCIKK